MKWGIELLGDTHRTQLWRVYVNISVAALIAELWLCEITFPVSLLCVLTFILHCTALPKDWGSMKWGNILLNTQYIFSQHPPQSYQTQTSTQYCFSLGIVFNTHRLTIKVAQFTVVSESRNKSYVLWGSLSRLIIPHVIDPQSISKAVQWNKDAPSAILKYNTSSVINRLSLVDFL
jgi:hypothetical protein